MRTNVQKISVTDTCVPVTEISFTLMSLTTEDVT